MTDNIDPDTLIEHCPPSGMEHHNRRKNDKFYATLKIRHFLIKEHQTLFPDLEEQMKRDPTNATNIYSAFLIMLPLEVKGRLTPELKMKILKLYRIV